MTEAEQLYLALAVLLIVESVCLAGGTSLVFYVRDSRLGRCFWPEHLYRHRRGFLLLANPLPPFKRIFEVSFPPLSFSPKGVLSCPPCALDLSFWLGCPHSYLPYDDIRSASAGGDDRRTLLLNGLPFAHCCDPTQAKELADFLMEMSKAPHKKREALLKKMLHAPFQKAIWEKRAESALSLTECLPALCALQFGLIFVFAPASVLLYGFNASLLPLLAVLELNTVFLLCFFWRAHRRLYPEAFWKRLGACAKMFICPSIATRALLFSTRDALRGCSPALASLLLESPDSARPNLGRLLRDLRNPLPFELPAEAAETLAWHRDFLGKEIEKLLLEAGGKAETELAPPPRSEECLSYCPRCLAQYTIRAGVCPDCASLPLRSFAE